VKYKPNSTKKKVSNNQLELAREIINKQAPFQSSHNHCLKLKDDTRFYMNYHKRSLEIKPMARSSSSGMLVSLTLQFG
jgi:hypothetical protein